MKRKLTAASVSHIKPPKDRGLEVHDAACPGLSLRITPKGVRSYCFQARVLGRLQRHTLGRCPGLSLADARKKVQALREAIDEGRDPRLEREEAERDTALVDLRPVYR